LIIIPSLKCFDFTTEEKSLNMRLNQRGGEACLMKRKGRRKRKKLCPCETLRGAIKRAGGGRKSHGLEETKNLAPRMNRGGRGHLRCGTIFGTKQGGGEHTKKVTVESSAVIERKKKRAQGVEGVDALTRIIVLSFQD